MWEEGIGKIMMRAGGVTNQELAGDENENAIVGRGLGVEGGNLVLDLLEGEALWNAECQPRNKARPQAVTNSAPGGDCFRDSYRELLDDGVDTEDGGRLKGQHRLGPLFCPHSLVSSLP